MAEEKIANCQVTKRRLIEKNNQIKAKQKPKWNSNHEVLFPPELLLNHCIHALHLTGHFPPQSSGPLP